jgi:uncharacterized RDD family membrane protein YckC
LAAMVDPNPVSPEHEPSVEPGRRELEPSVAYATFGVRLRAYVIDLAVVLGVVVAVVLIGDLARDVPSSGRILVFVLFANLFLYEPLMIWRFGATIGHRVENLQVVDAVTGQNPGFWRACLRFVAKSFFGMLSFATMTINRRHQAIHDLITHTTVRIRNVAAARPDDYAPERVIAPVAGLPSRLRRISVIIGYCLVVYAGYVAAAVYFESSACRHFNQCTIGDFIVAWVLALTWLAAAATCIIAGWRGQLLGAMATVEPRMP